MNPHYDNYLVRKYPLLYRDRRADMTRTLMCWGFSCGDGWFNIINNLSAALSAPHLNAKYRYEYMREHPEYNPPEKVEEQRLIMEQLREQHPIAVQVKEKFGGLRFYADNITPELDGYIRFAELLASNTCEVCGERGKRRTGGWIRTLCNKHEFERQQKDKE